MHSLDNHTSIDDAVMQVRSLSVSYGGVIAVDDISLDVRDSSFAGLIGPNGAGKTSLLDALTGHTRGASGRVVLGGVDISAMRAHRRAQLGMSRTFQSVELFDDLTVRDNLLVAATPLRPSQLLGRAVRRSRPERHVEEWIEEILEMFDLADVRGHYPPSLSYGRRKLVGVARALAPRPRIVLLDEPAAGLDTEESNRLGEHLREFPRRGIAVLLVDHDMGLVLSVCDNIFVLDGGRLIATGSPAAIRRDPTVIEAYLGSELAHAVEESP